MTLIGRKILPCGHQRVRFPEEPGDYQRTCTVCKRTFDAMITESEFWKGKLGVTAYVLHWDDDAVTPHQTWQHSGKQHGMVFKGLESGQVSERGTERVAAPALWALTGIGGPWSTSPQGRNQLAELRAAGEAGEEADPDPHPAAGA